MGMIASRFGVSKQLVHNIKVGRCWAELTGALSYTPVRPGTLRCYVRTGDRSRKLFALADPEAGRVYGCGEFAGVHGSLNVKTGVLVLKNLANPRLRLGCLEADYRYDSGVQL